MSSDDALVVRTMSVSKSGSNGQLNDVPEVIVVNRSPDESKPYAGNGFDERIGSPDSGHYMINENEKAVVVSNPSLVSDFQEKVNLSWEDLSVVANLPKPSLFKRCLKRGQGNAVVTKKQILFDVNGKVEAGTLLAVMGASGAGKTTLMNTLAHQNISMLDISGSIKVNGQEIGKKMKTISAYVQQEDLFIGTLTVREHLIFQALLRIDSTLSKEEKYAKADKVIHELGLTKCKDTIIGVPGRIRGISGGEMKRLSFASEILTNPSLLFVDEPTSGLDAFMAQSVIGALQKMSDSGRTIVATIHQPSSEVYNMFNKVLYMSEGRVAYIGKTQDALPFFSNLGYVCPANYNPADFFISTLAIVPGREVECKERAKGIADSFEEYAAIHHSGQHHYHKGSDEAKLEEQGYKVGFFRQMSAVLWRSTMSNKREPFVSTIKTAQVIAIALLAGLIYLQQTYDQDSIQNIAGAMFFCITSSSFNSMTSALFVFPAELPVFLKEHKLGMYRCDSYFLSKMLAELPWYMLGPFLFSTIVYWMIGLRSTFENYIIFCCIILLINQCSLSYGYLISTISPSVQVASALGAPMMMPFLLFGGFFLKDESVPPYFIWLKYLSWFKYSFEALLVNQWDGFGSISCPKVAPTLALSNATTATTAVVPCIKTGQQVLKYFDLDATRLGLDIGILVVLAVAFRVLAFIFLVIRASRR
ncbi:protein white-like isoform X1 [Rhopilema esculentum]|uniref:protein white-like isoform X1 n=1 Tax=Rhopilema esculentum TaxID=499914 RepID=UPI0031E06507